MGLTKNLGWLSKYITASSNGNISLGSDSGLGFQLLSSTDNTRGLYMGYNYTGNYAQIEAVHQNVGYKNIVLNPSGGSIGIGVSSGLTEKLTLDGNMQIKSGGAVKFNRTDNAISTDLYDAGTYFALNNRNGNGFDFQSAGTSQVKISASGHLGIGVAIPNFRLDVSSGTSGTIAAFNSTRVGGGGITLMNNSSARAYIGNANWVGISGESTSSTAIAITSAENSAIIFGTNAAYAVSDKMRILPNGNVLIGTQTDNGYKLNVSGSSSVSGTARASNFSPYNFVGVTAGSPSSATIPLGYSSISVAALCDGQWRPLLTNLNDVKAFCWVTMGDAASKDTGSYQMAFTNPSYGVNAMSNLTYSDNGWNTGSFGLSYDTTGGSIRLIMINTSYYSSGNYASGTIHFLRLE